MDVTKKQSIQTIPKFVATLPAEKSGIEKLSIILGIIKMQATEAGKAFITNMIAKLNNLNLNSFVDTDACVWQYHKEIPTALKPLYLGYSYLLGYAFYFYFLIVSKSSDVEILGEKDLTDEKWNFLKTRDNYIFCAWHEFGFAMFVVVQYLRSHPELFRMKPTFLMHPNWSFGPLYVLFEKSGCKLVMGSTGNSGKQGANALVEAIKRGDSAVILPDGPYGPPHEAKKGILHIAEQSKVPIVPLKIEFTKPSGYLNMFWQWDNKKFPLPKSGIRCTFSNPATVASQEDFLKVQNYIRAKL